MDSQELENYRKAGKIAKDVREWSRPLVKDGEKILDLANKIEERIKKSGGELAFPVNICINDVTAHYAPKWNDTITIAKEDVVSVDLGVHIDGYIADTAYTLDLSGKHEKMLKANELALSKSIELVKPGLQVKEVGRVVQETLTSAGFKPIENLTGHEVDRYDLHAGLSVPNIPVPYDWKIEEGMVIALEPFATNGYGRVVETKFVEIFSLINPKPTRMSESRILLKELESRKTLPFAARWFTKKISPMKLDLVLRDMVFRKILKDYPTLHEKEKGIVSQFEHTVIVTKNGCEVIT